jgi:hypothetical protein
MVIAPLPASTAIPVSNALKVLINFRDSSAIALVKDYASGIPNRIAIKAEVSIKITQELLSDHSPKFRQEIADLDREFHCSVCGFEGWEFEGRSVLS